MATHTEAKRLLNQVLAGTTHYEVLGIPAGAKLAVVKEAHRTLARLFHPDRCILKNAHDVMTRVNGAYAVLGDKEARRKYDTVQRTSDTVCTTCEGSGLTYKQRGFARRVSVECSTCKGTGLCE